MRSSFVTRLGVALVAGLAGGCSADAETHALQIGGHAFEVEVADTAAERERGLMHRAALPDNGGMLFVFERDGRHCFWMRDTPLPLSIAFIDAGGRIVNLADMQPNTRTPHCPSAPARYALEIRQGGFAERGIVAGAEVRGLP